MKNKKIIITIICVALVLAIVAVICFVVFKKAKERKIIYETFKVRIEKDDEQLYFERDAVDESFCHAAYKVSDERYEQIFNEMMQVGYKEREIATAKDKYWIPYDHLLKAYRIVEGEIAPDAEYMCKYIYVTESKDGYVEIYFVSQVEIQAKENFIA